eukprot:UN32869
MKPHCKWTVTLTNVREMIPKIRKAFDIAQSGVPGPVFVETPLDTIWPEDILIEESNLDGPRPELKFNVSSVLDYFVDAYQRRHISNIFKDAWEEPPVHQKAIYYTANFKPSDMMTICSRFRSCRKPVIVLGSQSVLRPRLIPRLVKAIEFLGVPVYLSGMARGLMGREHKQQMRHKRGDALKRAGFVMLAGVPADFRLDYGRSVGKKAYFCMVNLDKVQ